MNSPFSLRHSPAAPAAFAAFLSGLVAMGLPFPSAAAESRSPTPSSPSPTESTTPTEQGSQVAEKPAETAGEKAADETPAPTEAAPGEFRSWFDVTVGGLLVDGDKGAAQRRFGLPATAFGGSQRFHFEQDVGKKGLFKIDGRGIFDNEDYGLALDWTETDKAYVRAGIDQYRTFSDGSAGWYPGTDLWLPLYDERLDLVRGTAFFEAGLRMPALPEITIRYQHDWRDGLKDSTHWGDTTLTGGAGPRAIVPAFRDIDETTDTLSIDVRKTVGNVTFGGAFAYEHAELDDGTYLRRSPYEAADRRVTQRESVESDLYNARAFADTIFNDKIRVATAYAFTTLDTDLGGSRIVGSDYDAVYDPVFGRRDIGFLGLTGGSQLDQHVWNVGGMWTPFPHFAVTPAFRVENQSLDGRSSWTDTGAETIARQAANDRDMLDLSQKLELRYTGVTNVVFYVRGDWVQGDGNLLEQQTLVRTGDTEIHRDSDFDRFSQKYAAGTHWYPLKQINLHAQYYRKIRSSDYDHDPASRVVVSGFYPAYLQAQDFTTDDVNLRVTWRPLDKLTFVSRYDYQLTTFDTRPAGLPSRRAGQATAHILGETITWTPFARFYVQPGVNYVLDTTESAAAGAATVDDAENDYLNLTCTTGVVLDDKTDFQTQYTYYLSDNFTDTSALTQPFGSGTEEHGILASVIRRISPRLRVTLRYGFFTSRDDLAGGYNDYDAHLVSVSARYLF